METSLPLGRVAGIRIGLNWSVVVVAALICWNLAEAGLPTSAPGYRAGAYWVAAVVGAGAFFASLVAHEVGHSVVARRRGVVVNEITLWMLGGVAKLEQQPERAGDELRIALAGPAVSMGIGVGAGLLALALAAAGAGDLVVAVPAWLASINLILAVFNLIPAFPTDGGRVLRALLWARSGDQLSATITAAGVGRTAGWVLVVLGAAAASGGAGLGGVWFAVIGLFLVFASGMEAAATQERALLAGVRVGDVMTKAPVTAPTTVSVAELLDSYVLRHRVSAYPLVDSTGDPVGLVTLAHIRAVPTAKRAATPALAVATPLADAVVTRPDEPLIELVARLAASPEGRALVLEGARLVGVVALSDVARAVDVAALARGTGVLR